MNTIALPRRNGGEDWDKIDMFKLVSENPFKRKSILLINLERFWNYLFQATCEIFKWLK